MNPQKHTPPKRTTTAAAARARRHEAMRSAVLQSLIVCPHGGVAHRRHGQGAMRRAT